jgi:transposase-like protein
MEHRRKAVPEHVRAQVLAEAAAGNEVIAHIAKKHGIHVSTIYQWRHAAKKQGGKIIKVSGGHTNGNAPNIEREANDRVTERHVIFAFAHCQTWLEVYANSLSIPPAYFAERVGQLLQFEARGKKLRPDHRMPGMW